MSDMRINGAGAAFAQQNSAKKQRSLPDSGESPPAPPLPSPPDQKKESPSLYEMMQEAREKAEAYKKRLQLPKSNLRYADAPMQAYARLAKARNRAQIDAASGYARRCIAQFKTAMRQDSDNADRIKAAINQLQKAVNRAGKKKRDLEREKLVDLQRARFEQDDELRQAQRLQQELRRRRMMRAIREHGYIREAEVDNRFQEQMSATRAELQEQAQMLSGSVSPSADTTVQPCTAPVETSAEISGG